MDPKQEPQVGMPDPNCTVCFGRGRYDDGDCWVKCPCVATAPVKQGMELVLDRYLVGMLALIGLTGGLALGFAIIGCLVPSLTWGACFSYNVIITKRSLQRWPIWRKKF